MKKIIVTALLMAMGQWAMAQDEIDQLIKGSKEDANYLVGGYAAPALKAFASGLSQGWYNTAKTHNFPGADLTISVGLVKIPTSDYFYTVDNSKLTSLNQVDASNGITPVNKQVPTFMGPEQTPRYNFKTNGVPSPTPTTAFDGPQGLDPKKQYGVGSLPVPVANLGIGLPKGFDLKLRFVPTIDLGDGQFGLFGVGIMHDVKQYIPGIKNLPFDLSGFVGYTKMKLDVDLNASGSQTANFAASATTIQGLISKKLSVITVYGGLGYNIAKSTLDMKGTYDLGGGQTVKDPVAISASVSGPRATAGLRLKLAVFTFHGDYTLQKYSTITAGFGISVR